MRLLRLRTVLAATDLTPTAEALPLALTLLARAVTHATFLIWVLAANPSWFDHTRHDWAGSGRARDLALLDPLSAAGFVALGLALYAGIMGPPTTTGELRNYAAIACAGLSCVFAAAAARAMSKTVSSASGH